MNGTGEDVLNRFLQEISAMKSHSSKTFGRSLKKPLLLLLLISKIAHGIVTDNRFRFRHLRDELARLIDQYGGRRTNSGPGQPFSHLRRERFWRLTTQRSYPSGKTILVSDLMDERSYGSFASDVFALLVESQEAQQLVFQHILDEWCPAELHGELREVLGMPRTRR